MEINFFNDFKEEHEYMGEHQARHDFLSKVVSNCFADAIRTGRFLGDVKPTLKERIQEYIGKRLITSRLWSPTNNRRAGQDM